MKVQIAVSMQLQRALTLHDPSRGIRVLSSQTISNIYIKKKKKYILFNHKCSSCTSSAMCMHDLKYCVIMLEKSPRLCTPVQKGSVGWKRHPSTSNMPDIIVLPFFFIKGVWLSLHVCFVNTRSVLPSTSHMRDYVMREVKLVQDEHLWLKSIYICIFLRKWLVIWLDKTYFPQVGSCRALWSCIETSIWTFNPLAITEVNNEENPEMFSPKTFIYFQLKKDRWVNLSGNFHFWSELLL